MWFRPAFGRLFPQLNCRLFVESDVPVVVSFHPSPVPDAQVTGRLEARRCVLGFQQLEPRSAVCLPPGSTGQTIMNANAPFNTLDSNPRAPACRLQPIQTPSGCQNGPI